ncbi:uncharacterized protein VTP21DRAFT_4330 [Calcarisporiella thermophila]|uniref:uncharacterized protein n=1 Tax=Calcarisporiella thermophila TaxID=911321 RepID=UPI0037437D1E
MTRINGHSSSASIASPVSTGWRLHSSYVAQRTLNPIRKFVEGERASPNPEKELVNLTLGDPTASGIFRIDDSCSKAVIHAILSAKANGYPPAIGTEEARQAIASRYSRPNAILCSKDIIVTSGTSGALDICFTALCDEGDNVLIPRPGFPLYGTLARSKGIEERYYDLVPEHNWEADIEQMETLVDERTKFIVVNNREHLLAIIALAQKHYLPILADEVYEDMVFSPHIFYPLASLSATVPVLTVSGLGKRFLVPGWRVGWILIHDPVNAFAKEARDGLVSVSQLILGANSLIQAALPKIFTNTPQLFFECTNRAFENHARTLSSLLTNIPGLRVIEPQGAMYMMVGIDIKRFSGLQNDIEFARRLMEEESVNVLPGTIFQCPNFIRIAISAPLADLEEAAQRLHAFCQRHLHIDINAYIYLRYNLR